MPSGRTKFHQAGNSPSSPWIPNISLLWGAESLLYGDTFLKTNSLPPKKWDGQLNSEFHTIGCHNFQGPVIFFRAVPEFQTPKNRGLRHTIEIYGQRLMMWCLDANDATILPSQLSGHVLQTAPSTRFPCGIVQTSTINAMNERAQNRKEERPGAGAKPFR